MRRGRGLLGLGVVIVGCSAPVELRVDFQDPVVEARARGLVSQVVFGPTCGDLFERTTPEVSGLASLLGQRSVEVPFRPDDALPELAAPPGAELHVAARDGDGRVFARGCAAFDANQASIALPLYGLPPCALEPRALDLAVVFDGSSEMGRAQSSFGDVAEVFRSRFVEIADFPPGSRFSLIAHGDGAASVEFSEESSASALADAVDRLADGGYTGASDGFAAIARAARELRDRATCIRRPVMLVVAAGDTLETVEAVAADAAVSLYAVPGERIDDVFTYAVALSPEALEDLLGVVPDSVGEVRETQTRATLESTLVQASFSLRQRVSSSGD